MFIKKHLLQLVELILMMSFRTITVDIVLSYFHLVEAAEALVEALEARDHFLKSGLTFYTFLLRVISLIWNFFPSLREFCAASIQTLVYHV